MIAAALLALALAAGAEAVDVGVAPYREAAQTGQVGVYVALFVVGVLAVLWRAIG